MRKNKNDEVPPLGIIYMAKNKVNNELYIGASTSDLESRIKDHLTKSRNNSGHDFHKSIATYGENAFSWTSIDTANTIEELARKERFYIDNLNSLRNGYNSDQGGGFKKPVYQYSEEGKLLNTFTSLSEAANAMDVNEKAISKACFNVNQKLKGYIWSYDYKDPYVPNTDKRFKEIEQLDKEGKVLKTFKSVAEAARITGINKSSIAKVCRNTRKLAGGFSFRFVENMDNISSSSSSLPSSPPFIYVTHEASTMNTDINAYTATSSSDSDSLIFDSISTSFPLLGNGVEYAFIPKKVEQALRNHVPKIELMKVNKNIDSAVEKCLYVLSNLTSTYFSDKDWKPLSSQVLHEQTRNGNHNTYVYKTILNILEKGTKLKGPIIENKTNSNGNASYKIGESSKQFSLTDTYKKGLVKYQFKDEDILNKRKAYYSKSFIESEKDPICKNLLLLTNSITLPTEEELFEKGKELVKKPTYSGKGKRLTFRNKHSNEYWKDWKNRSFVEDDITLFNHLTNPLRIPKVGSKKSGGRIVDSFTLMPKWIRKCIKIDGDYISILDYNCLHPNLAKKIYGGTNGHISHQQVADYLGISRSLAKKEHLSFFNKKWEEMKKSPLFKYYKENEPEMMEEIRRRKMAFGYRITSKELFTEEVIIMRKAIAELNSKNILVGYVYDALFCHPNSSQEVLSVMNKVIKERGVNTVASSD